MLLGSGAIVMYAQTRFACHLDCQHACKVQRVMIAPVAAGTQRWSRLQPAEATLCHAVACLAEHKK
jgi:hypothetical protein